MRTFSSQAGRLALAVAMVALTACGDHFAPSATAPAVRPQHALSGGGGTDPSPTIAGVIVPQRTLLINGPSVGYTATVNNPGLADGLSLQGYVIQGSTKADVGRTAVVCGATSCTVAGTLRASGTTLVPGPATFQLKLLDEVGAVLNTKTVAVTLVSIVISHLDAISSEILLGGPSIETNLTVQNDGPALSGVELQGWINQGTARRAAGTGFQDAAGLLPNGTIAGSIVIALSLGSGPTEALVPGPATFELQLTWNGTVLATKTVPVMLGSSVTISALTPTSGSMVIDGASVPYTATLQNVGSSQSGLLTLNGRIYQGAAFWSDAGGWSPTCGGSSEFVVPNGTCTVVVKLTATNATNGNGYGTLVPGAATLALRLEGAYGTVLDTMIVQVTLTNP